MKKLYIYLLFTFTALLLFSSNNLFAQAIDVSGVPTTLCANEGFSVSYVVTGPLTLNPGNKFQVYLSDVAGSFVSEQLIGEAFSTSPTGSVYVVIPEFTVLSPTSTYRILVKSTDNAFTGSDNGANIVINCTTRDYYWIGGSGDWSDVSHWEYYEGAVFTANPAVPPRPVDNANFDAFSFPTGGTLTFDQFIDINDFYWEPGSGVTNPAIVSNGNGLQLKGDLFLDAGVITQFGGIYFNSTKENIEIDYGDNLLSNNFPGEINFFGGGSWDLNSEMTADRISIYDGGTFYTNDFQVNLNSSIYGNGAAGNTIDTGSSDIYLSELLPNGMAILGSATWYLSNPNGFPLGFGSGYTFNIVIIEEGEYDINGTNTFDQLILMPGSGIRLNAGQTQTIISNFNAVGTRDQMVSITSNFDGNTGTIAAGGATVTADFVAIQDNIITGAIPYLADNSINDGGNTGWDFTTNPLIGLNYYWVGGSGNWTDNLAHWGKLPGGGGFRVSPPGALDDVYFTTTSFPSGGTITIDSDAECNIMKWEIGSGSTNPSLYADYNNSLTVNGDFTLDDGVSRNISDIFFYADIAQTQFLDFGDNLYTNGAISLNGGGTWELQSDFGASVIHLREGTFNSNNYQLDAEQLFFWDNQISTWGSSIVNISDGMFNNTASLTMDPGSSSFNFEPQYAYWSVTLDGPFVLFDATFSGNAYINTSNFFNNLTFLPGSEITLDASTTQSIAGGTLTATGLRDQPIKIKSSSDGVQANISQALGTINTEYLILQDNNVTGGATFNTTNYTINGNVTGWTLGTILDSFDFYWVGGTGDWSDNTHWSQGDGDLVNIYSFAPGSTDNVFFTSGSFTSTGQIVTIDNSVEINNMTWVAGSGTNSPSIFGDYNVNLIIHGNLAFDNGVQRDISQINFDSPNAGNTINLADNQAVSNNGGLIFNGGGSWDLQSRLEASYVTISDATLTTLNNEMSLNSLTLSSAFSILSLGSSDFYLEGLNDYSGGTSTLSAGTSNIIITEGYNGFSGSFALNDVNVLNGGNFLVQSSFSVNTLTLDPGATLEISQGVTLTTNNISATGTSGSPIRIKSDSQGNEGYISQASGIVSADFLLISDNWAQTTGTATFSATNSIDAGNTGGLWLPLSAPVTQNYYWVGGGGNWSDAATHWADADGGTNFYGTPPGIADNVFFTLNSFTAGAAETVIIDQNAFCNNMTWTTSLAQSPTLFGPFDTQLKVFGSFILTNGVQRNIAELIFESYNAGNMINMADNLKGSFADISFRGSGEWTLANDFEGSDVEFEGGTFNTGNFDLRVDDWRFSNSDPKTFNAGSSHIYSSSFGQGQNLTFNKGTSTLHIIKTQKSNNSIDGSLNFYDVIIEDDVVVWGANSYNSLIVNDGITVELSSNDVQLVSSLALNGIVGSPIIIKSTNTGIQGTFSVPSNGSVSASYVILEDNNATGGAFFTATNSSEVSNVTGWTGLKTGQTITFPSLDDIIVSGTLNLTASSSSGLTISYSVVPITGTASITGVNNDVLTPLSSGLVGVIASQAGNGTYGFAETVTRYVHLNVGNFANELGQMKQASYVVGTPNGVSEGEQSFGNMSNKNLPGVTHALVSTDGKLIAAGMGRVMIWNQLPDAYDVPADVVVGQADFTSFSQTASRTVFGLPNEIFTGSVALGPTGQLIVSDARGVLIWNSIPTTNGAPADVIIGQTDFTTTTMEISQDKFLSPLGVAVSTDGKLLIGDISAHRILIYNSIPITNGALADVVIGQPDFTTGTPGTSQKNLAFPGMISITPDNRLLIADITNNRVLVYNSIPTTDYATADIVIGQSDFDSSILGTTANSLSFPMMASVSKTGKLAISDWENNRVLIYNQIPANNTVLADLVIGQPDFVTNGLNEDEITLRVIGAPFGVTWDISENLIITDSGLDGLSRVMVYGEKDLTPPVAFTTGTITAVGGNVVANYLNAANTSVDITVPIANDPSLNGGIIQMQVKIGTGTFVTIGGNTTILNASLGVSQVVSVTPAALQTSPDYAQDSTIVFRAILIDVVGNQTVGSASTSTITIDTVAPIAFTTGAASSVGGTIVTGYWSGTNTSMDVLVPVDNDASLDGGNLQMQVQIGAGAFVDIGTPISLTNLELGTTIIPSISAAELIASVDYAQNAIITYQAMLTDVAGNQTIGTQSASSTIIDTVFPLTFTTGNVAVTGGTVISNIWNSTNTSINVTVPIENEASIDGGSVQLQVKFGAGSFIDIGAIVPITATDLVTGSVTITISETEFESAVGYAQNATVTFTAKINDIAGNLTTGTESTTVLTIDESASAAFTTGNAVTVGGSVNAAYWNTTNTSIDVTVPIENDLSLIGGTVQMQLKIGAGTFADIGAATTIVDTTSVVLTVIETDLEALTDYAEGASIFFRATITTSGGNQAIGAESTTILLIDTVVPADFTTGTVITTGQPEFVVADFWNANNDGVEVTIPIDNTDASLDGGSIQLQMAIDGGSFVDIGTIATITASDITNTSLLIALSKTDFEGIVGLAEKSVITANTIITDVAGNPQPGTQSTTALTVDRIAPAVDGSSTIATTFVVGANTTSTLKLDATSETSGIKEVTINYQLISSSLPDEFITSAPITEETNGDYIIKLVDYQLGSSELHGLMYYLDLVDSAGNKTTTARQAVNIKYANGIPLNNSFGVGSVSEDYRIMTIPLVLDDAKVNTIFNDIYGGTYDNSKMRIFSYAGGTGTTYSELNGSSTFVVGRGYFALSASSATITSPAGNTSFEPIENPDLLEEQGFTINLVSGWNLIGNPFLHSINWADIITFSQTNTNDIRTPQSYKGSYSDATSIAAREGVFVFNNSGGSFSLKIPVKESTGGRVSGVKENTNPLDEPSWEVLFKTNDKTGKEHTLGGVGMEEEAIESLDQFDRLNPPALTSSKVIDFNHPEFMSPSFKKDVRELALEQKWNFEYKVVDPENPKQEIHWNNSYFGDNSPEIYLIDKTHFATINMKDVNSYTFNHGTSTSFEVHFGYDVLDQIVPDGLITQSPFPNPFNNEITFNLGLPQDGNYSVQVRIFDSVGKLVRSISEDNILAGYNSVVWDGHNKDGGLIPNGIYAYSIHIKGESIDTVETGKIIKR
jgi:FlgD Ig-like domain